MGRVGANDLKRIGRSVRSTERIGNREGTSSISWPWGRAKYPTRPLLAKFTTSASVDFSSASSISILADSGEVWQGSDFSDTHEEPTVVYIEFTGEGTLASGKKILAMWNKTEDRWSYVGGDQPECP